MQAAVDIGGVFDPTPTLDIVGASMSAESGDYWGAGASILGAALPYAGDLAKGPKIAKGIGVIAEAIEGAKSVNGNSKLSKNAQHVYEIINNATNKVEKVGISGGKVTKSGYSYRANNQVNKLNKAGGILPELPKISLEAVGQDKKH